MKSIGKGWQRLRWAASPAPGFWWLMMEHWYFSFFGWGETSYAVWDCWTDGELFGTHLYPYLYLSLSLSLSLYIYCVDILLPWVVDEDLKWHALLEKTTMTWMRWHVDRLSCGLRMDFPRVSCHCLGFPTQLVNKASLGIKISKKRHSLAILGSKPSKHRLTWQVIINMLFNSSQNLCWL